MDDRAAVIEFEIRVPVDANGLCANVRDCLTRGLPELRHKPQRHERLTVVANGPTARHAPLNGPSLAINNALSLFTAQGLAPTYWIGCDPQPLLADFLADAPPETTYLVASKCHPSVFDALTGRKVIVWHIDDVATWGLLEHRDAVLSSVSVTICAFEVMSRLGFRKFDVWGWDGCFIDGEANAVAQWINPERRKVIVGGQTFESTPMWALEAQDAVNKLAGIRENIAIHGGGMVGAIFDALLPIRKAA